MNPSRGQSTSHQEQGRIARLVYVATLGYSHARMGRGIDFGTGNGLVRGYVSRHLFVPFDGVDVAEVPSRDDYAIATCFDVLEHAHGGEDVLEKIREIVAPEGILAMTLPNRWWFFETHAAFPFNRLPFFNWGPWRHWLRRKVGRGVRCYTLKQAENTVERAGFEVLSSGYLSAPLDKFIGGGLVRNHHETRVPFFATNVFVIARRKED